MELESLAKDLQVAGLEPDQAEVYVRLLHTGPAAVGQLSQFFDCSRSTLYRLLDELAEQGYVTKSLERPTVFEPVEPDELFELSLDALERKRERVASVRDRRLKALESLVSQTAQEGAEHTWRKIETTEKIYHALHDMAEQAEQSLWSVSNHQVTMSRFLPAVEEAWRLVYRRATEDGLDVRLLFDFDEEPYEQIPEWVEPVKTFQLRDFHAGDETIHFVLVDESDLLMWVRPAPLGTLGKRDDIAVRTNAPGSVFAHRMLFDRLWTENEPVEGFGDPKDAGAS